MLVQERHDIIKVVPDGAGVIRLPRLGAILPQKDLECPQVVALNFLQPSFLARFAEQFQT